MKNWCTVVSCCISNITAVHNLLLVSSLLCGYDRLYFITCGGLDSLAGHADTGVMESHYCDVVVLSTGQVKEVTVGVGVVTLSIVAQTAPSIDSVRCGTQRRIPCDCSDAGVAVHPCCDVCGNAWSWWRTETGKCVDQCDIVYSCSAQACNILH